MEAGRWQKVMESEDGQTQAAKAGKTFCGLSALGIEATESRRKTASQWAGTKKAEAWKHLEGCL